MTTEPEQAFIFCTWLKTRSSRQLFLLAKYALFKLGYDLDKTKKLLIKLEEK